MFIFINLSILLSGCAGVLPVPGGDSTINKSFYESDVDMKQRIASLEEGMAKDEVFSRLEVSEDDVIILSRQEIMAALYGGQRLEFAQDSSAPLANRSFLQSLSGYKLLYKKVKRKHGISSPISMRTNEHGYSYSTIFIFKDDLLYERPVTSGGLVDSSSSRTLFDYLSPETVMGRVGI